MAGNGCPGCHSNYGQNGHSWQDAQEAERAQVPDQGRSSPTIFNPFYTGRPRTPAGISKTSSIDRQEIIRRIKSASSRSNSPETIKSNELKRKPLLSPGGTSKSRSGSPEVRQDNDSVGLQIQRPRSALHSGDFRDIDQTKFSQKRLTGRSEHELPVFSTSPVPPWHSEFPAAGLRQICEERTEPDDRFTFERQRRSRATSNASIAGSFVYKAPTSPLVQSSRPDTPEPSDLRSGDRLRRHTFSPQSFQRFQSSLDYPLSSRRQAPSLRAEKTFPYQAHQPMRSLQSTSYASTPQTPASGPRRPSFSDSPLHHAPMVGSYEESILRGRMSTIPSKPLNFVAQIGVLGKGNCKSSLRCPRHVSVPFPAVFYSYGAGSKAIPGGDEPSPYVGLIDLETNLPCAQEAQERRSHRLNGTCSSEGSRASSRTREDASALGVQVQQRRRQKNKRRSGSPKGPPGGSYRIPEQGQLQIVIKNPNKTAVKLFLVPYDLSDMQPGQKTFIRQRSYSAGPIIDMPLTSQTPEKDKLTLRYLIHLHICCPSKGRHFLYKSLRVVFANRVPDGKEKLRNELQYPEPRYSAYRPGRDSTTGSHVSPEEAVRARSVIEQPAYSVLDSHRPFTSHNIPHSLALGEYSSTQHELPTLPCHVMAFSSPRSRPSSRQMSDHTDTDCGSRVSSPASEGHPPEVVSRRDDPFKFDRDRSRAGRGRLGNESLLSKRLMDLAFQAQTQQQEQE